MKVTSDIQELRETIAHARKSGKRIGCIPTMGALHTGHLSLVAEAQKKSSFTVLTIFVNPTQFGQNEDLNRYPRPIEADLAACKEAGVDCVFTPDITSLYPPGYQSWVTVDGLSTILEGEFRPGHFRGVTTIVAKLFNLVQPDVACFGSKDYQQLAVISQMTRDLDFPIEIVGCPIIRDEDGLAKSSRNIYLSAEERKTALTLSETLRTAKNKLIQDRDSIQVVQKWMQDKLESTPGLQLQYAEIRHSETLEVISDPVTEAVILVAAYVGKTRLIDNIQISLG